MSSAGVIYDMIRRDKANREMRSQLRQKRKDRRTASKIGAPSTDTNVTWEELDQISRRLKEKKELDEQKTNLLILIIFAGVLVLGLLLVWVFKIMD